MYGLDGYILGIHLLEYVGIFPAPTAFIRNYLYNLKLISAI